MIDACKGIVKYLKKASASTALPHGLVQECETRWNSKIDMLKSVSKQYREINELLESRGQSERMEGIYQNTLTTVIDFLEPFKKASEELQGEDYPTLHLVMLWFYNLSAHCTRLRALARRILCIPASSAASECTFSSAGRVIEARRNPLNPGTVDSILFLHSARKAKYK